MSSFLHVSSLVQQKASSFFMKFDVTLERVLGESLLCNTYKNGREFLQVQPHNSVDELCRVLFHVHGGKVHNMVVHHNGESANIFIVVYLRNDIVTGGD